jgi:hypothetical protein
VTVSVEISGPDASRPYISAAAPEHPSLIDTTHRLEALFGVVNVPNVIWIDEAGVIVRPAEPGWAGPAEVPESFVKKMIERGKREATAQPANDLPNDPPKPDLLRLLGTGQDRDAYPDAIRDWARNGATSEFSLSPERVVAASQPRSISSSEAAAHLDLATHFWHAGDRELSIRHFNDCIRLAPDVWTYKRQAWSIVGMERVGAEFGQFTQNPLPGEEADWPFESSFHADVALLEPGEYYPNTM